MLSEVEAAPGGSSTCCGKHTQQRVLVVVLEQEEGRVSLMAREKEGLGVPDPITLLCITSSSTSSFASKRWC
jgi:hypothetical protein